MLKILWKRGKIAPQEQFLPLSTIFYYLMLDFYVKTGIRFSLRDKRLFEITEVEITRVDVSYTVVGPLKRVDGYLLVRRTDHMICMFRWSEAYKAELQRLEHLWKHENMFEIIMPGQWHNKDIFPIFFNMKV